jgi:NAD(P)H-dependent flavin oxidoreductase YrpB (nitropropane dioxygenase family)
LKTRFTEMLGIEHPIVLAAMAFVTNAEMVAAISEAGALGTIGDNAGYRAITTDVNEKGESLRQQIRTVRSLTDNPFAVNVVLGEALPGKEFSERCMRVSMEEHVPIAIVSQGNPARYTRQLQEAGMKVIHVCTAVSQALSAQKAGVDAIVASGAEVGRSGFDQNSIFCLVPKIARVVNVPVIAGGGVANGRQLTAALALGAEGVYVGTRFIATQECSADQHYKKMIIRPVSKQTEFTSERIRELIFELSSCEAAFIYSDPEIPFWAEDQSVGLINEVISCAEVVRRMVTEAEQTCQDLANRT